MMPESVFRLGITNGLMSESMVIWFAIMPFMEIRSKRLNGRRIAADEKDLLLNDAPVWEYHSGMLRQSAHAD